MNADKSIAADLRSAAEPQPKKKHLPRRWHE